MELRETIKPNTPFLAAGIRCHNKGIFLKPDFQPKDIALDKLFKLKKSDLVINITFAWEGAVTVVEKEADGALVSHRFPTYTFRKGYEVDFYKHVVRARRFVFDLGVASPGGAGRNRVLRKKELLKIQVSTPSLKEQTAIAKVLSTADQEITLQTQHLTHLRQQKKALMQQLLTGKTRV